VRAVSLRNTARAVSLRNTAHHTVVSVSINSISVNYTNIQFARNLLKNLTDKKYRE
jgi:hypothetical protein